MSIMDKKFSYLIILFFTVGFFGVGHTDTGRNLSQIIVMHVKNVPVGTIVHDKTEGGKWVKALGTKEINLIKVAPNATNSQLHSYSHDVTFYFLNGESTFVDESGRKNLIKAGDIVFIPANTYFSSTSGRHGHIALLVGDNPDKKIYN